MTQRVTTNRHTCTFSDLEKKRENPNIQAIKDSVVDTSLLLGLEGSCF